MYSLAKSRLFFLTVVIILVVTVGFNLAMYLVVTKGSGAFFKYRTNVVNVKDSKYDTEDVYFYTSDNLKIYGELSVPYEPKALIILGHGWNMTHNNLVELSDYLYENNYATLNLDLRSRGLSEGEIKTAGYGESLDIEAAIGFSKKNKLLKNLPIGLLGHSAGSSAIFNTFNDSIKSVVSIAGITDFDKTLLGSSGVNDLPDKGKFVPFYINWYLKINGGFMNMPSFEERVENFYSKDTPVLFVHSIDDGLVPITQSIMFKEAMERKGSKNVELYELEGSNHFPWFKDDDFFMSLDYDVLETIVDFYDKSFNTNGD